MSAHAPPATARGNDRNSGYKRVAADWYAEGPEAVWPLLDLEHFDHPIHDPACGRGNVVRTFRAAGLDASGADLIDRANGEFEVVDFFRDRRRRPIIVTNPPFNCANRFVLHALELATELVCVLQQTTWLEGDTRHHEVFSRGLLARTWVFVDRVSIPPGGQDIERAGGWKSYSWFIFEPRRTPSELWQGGWIRSGIGGAAVPQPRLDL